MDNQNANNSGLSQGQNPPLNNSQSSKSSTGVGAENLRTQSVIETSREVAEKELAAQEAYNQQIIHQQQAAARRNKAAGIAIKVVLGLLGLIILVAIVWMIIEIATNSGPSGGNECTNEDGTINTTCCDRPESKDNIVCKEAPGKKATIDGYQCQTDECKKMTDIIKDELIVIYDTKFYLYDVKKKESTITTIDSSIVYNSMSSFEWGKGSYYIIMQPMTGNLGLYSVSGNAQIIDNTITHFYTDINHKAYENMKDVYGKQILVREDSQYRLYDLQNSGKQLAGGTNGVFMYGGFVVTFESDGSRRVLTDSGDQIIATRTGDSLYVKDNSLVHIRSGSLDVYNKYGVKQKSGENAVLDELRKVKTTERDKYLKDAKNKFFLLPTTRDYSD